MRGLKLSMTAIYTCVVVSHLLQMRGLKPRKRKGTNLKSVASFTDAWIETPKAPATPVVGGVASFTDAWIETEQKSKLISEIKSHLLQMRGLKP